MNHYIRWILLVFIVALVFASSAFARNHTINLTIHYKTVHFAGKASKSIAVNNQIPAPTLHFKEGDTVTIRVNNQLDKETALHWHGLLVPWQMDGVSGITQKAIAPKATFDYHFTLYQSGTYWYHAHSGLEEQQGLYGAFIIDPVKPTKYKYTKDEVVVLSDWSNTHPDTILANLKKDGDYYSPKFPLQPSLLKFIQDYRKSSSEESKALIADYKMMQQMRMGLYDLSDVAYDAFLLNGRPKTSPWTSFVKVGDIVRLRFIGAGASTIFRVKIPGTSMQMVHVQGNDVVPYFVDDFIIAPGETYDVLVKIQNNHPYIIYAESKDTLGHAQGALITNPKQQVDYEKVTPFQKPLPVTRTMMERMMGESHTAHMHMNHSMDMPTEPTIKGDTLSPFTNEKATTFGTTYQSLKAALKTNNPLKPIDAVLRMELFGYMGNYIWFINGVPEYNAHPILLKPNQRIRFVFTNPSMMSHPMHMHGHWFILRNGHGSFDPLLHTINIPAGATVTADVDTDASGQWLFHCHLLYHMFSGMSRDFQYTTLIPIAEGVHSPENTIIQTGYKNRPIVRVDKYPIDKTLVTHPMAHAMHPYIANFLELGEDVFHNTQKLNFKGLYGADFNKLQLFVNDAEIERGSINSADLDIFYWHLLNQFWAIKGGGNYVYRPAMRAYFQPGIGLEGVMPYFIETDIRGYYHNNSFKLDMEFSRDTQITNNFFITTVIRGILATKTMVLDEVGTGLNQMRYIVKPYYRIMPGLKVFVEYEHEEDYGAFRMLQLLNNEPSSQDTVAFGVGVLF